MRWILLIQLFFSMTTIAGEYYARIDLTGNKKFISNGRFYRSAPFGIGEYTGESYFFAVGKKTAIGSIEVAYGNYNMSSGYFGDPMDYDTANQIGANYYYRFSEYFQAGAGLHYFVISKKRFMSSNRIAPSFSGIGQVNVFKETVSLYLNVTFYGYWGHADQRMNSFSFGLKVNM